MKFIRYEESRPAQLREVLAEAPVAYVPFGALEWHGEHGPLGLDGLKAHGLCAAAAALTGGVVFPPVYWGAFDTMPFPFTFHFRPAGIKALVRQALPQLAGMGFQVIVLLTGHYPARQIKLLRRECRRFNRRGQALALGAPEQVFATRLDYYGDHAGMWETSIMLAMRPETVDLAAMPAGLPTLERLKRFGVMGQDPASRADAERGRQAIAHIAGELAQAVLQARRDRSDRAFEVLYENYDEALRPSRRLIREALDVHSMLELVRYGFWVWRNL